MSEVIENVAVETAVPVATPKRRGPAKGSKMPENMVPRDEFIRTWMNVSKAGGTRPDVVNELHASGFDYVDIGNVIQRERYMRKQGINLPELKSARGGGGGKRFDVQSLNELIAQLSAE